MAQAAQQQQAAAPAQVVEAPFVATHQAPVASKKSKKSKANAGKGGACVFFICSIIVKSGNNIDFISSGYV